MADQTQNADESLTTDNVSTGAKILIDNDVPENLYADPDGVPLSASVGASVPSATVSTGATVRLGDHVDASVHSDHVSTAAKILIDSDIPAKLYDDPEGATHSAQTVALKSPYIANDRRSSNIFPRKEDTSVPAADDTEPTAAGPKTSS